MLDIVMWFSTALDVQAEILENTLLEAKNELKLTEAFIATEAAFYAADISPFWTGALSSSHITEQSEEMTLVHINPGVRNPITGDPPEEYGVEVHERDAESAFYDRTVAEYGPELVEKASEEYLTRLEVVWN